MFTKNTNDCLKGYECIKIFIAILLNRLKGLMMYKEGVALKRKIVFPLFRTINVCGGRRNTETELGKLSHGANVSIVLQGALKIHKDVKCIRTRTLEECSLKDE